MGDPETLQQLKSDMKSAMKAKRKEELSTIRQILSSLNNKKIDGGGELSDDDVIEVLSKEAKQRKESIEAYREGDREDLAEKEEAELEVVERYLPEPLTDEEVGEMVDEIIEQTGAESPGDMGRVMGQIMPKVKGRFEGSKVKDIVLSKLQ